MRVSGHAPRFARHDTTALRPARPPKRLTGRCRALAALATLLQAFASPAAASDGAARAATTATISARVSTGWAQPFLLAGGDGARRGLIPDWYAALSRALGQPIQISDLPQRRMALARRSAPDDLRCFVSPGWRHDADTALDYDMAATPFLSVDEVLVSHPGSSAANGLADLGGRRVGTVAGYVYPSLEADFASGRLLRDDAPHETALLRKLAQRRTDHAVVRLWTLQHLQRLHPELAGLHALPLSISRTPLHCSVRRGAPVDLQRLAAAQQRLLADGSLERLLVRYGLTP